MANQQKKKRNDRKPVKKWTKDSNFFFFFSGFGFELRASSLLSRCSTAWVTPPVHFALIILEVDLSNYLSMLALNCDPPDLAFL
jgi:hypothetical protein